MMEYCIFKRTVHMEVSGRFDRLAECGILVPSWCRHTSDGLGHLIGNWELKPLPIDFFLDGRVFFRHVDWLIKTFHIHGAIRIYKKNQRDKTADEKDTAIERSRNRLRLSGIDNPDTEREQQTVTDNQ